MSDSQMNAQTDDMAPTRTTDEARQGVTGHGVRYVLFWGVGGAVAVFVIAGFAFYGS